MKKRIVLSLVLALILTACGSDSSSAPTQPTSCGQKTETTKQEPPETVLNEINNWIIGDVWNEGFCNFCHYEEDGTSSTGETIDIDSALDRFLKNYEKKAEYDSYVNSLSDEYSSVKTSWSKMIEQADILYEHYKDGVKHTGESTDTALFVQYRDAFSDDISDLASPVSSLDAIGDIEVDKGIFDVTINVPAEYMGETTQEELDEKATAIGYKVVLNDDGSATYTMSKGQHKKMMAEMTESFKTSLNEMVESENYPNFTNIKANADFTNFTITTKSTELDMAESFSTLGFYMYGAIYNIYNGTAVDNIHVDFVNADSGEIISSADSKNMN